MAFCIAKGGHGLLYHQSWKKWMKVFGGGVPTPSFAMLTGILMKRERGQRLGARLRAARSQEDDAQIHPAELMGEVIDNHTEATTKNTQKKIKCVSNEREGQRDQNAY